MLNVITGVKASLTLGREEKPWVKGLVGLNNVVEGLFSWREGGRFDEVWAPLKPYAFCYFGGISVCVRRRFYDSLER